MGKEPANKKKYKRQKLYTYASEQDIVRLRSICEKYSFNSIYQLLQHLLHCFLRVADPVNDSNDTPIPIEIEEMFSINTDWETTPGTYSSHEGMYHKQNPDQRKYKTPDDLKP